MENSLTVDDAFKLAIEIETLSCEFYQYLANLFKAELEVCNFFEGMSEDEKAHRNTLENVYQELNNDQKRMLLDENIAREQRRIIDLLNKNSEKEIKNLYDACCIVDEFENSETETLFKFLLHKFYSKTDRAELIDMVLMKHLNKVTKFTAIYCNSGECKFIDAVHE